DWRRRSSLEHRSNLQFEKVTIAAVNTIALGGRFMLVQQCDLVSPKANCDRWCRIRRGPEFATNAPYSVLVPKQTAYLSRRCAPDMARVRAEGIWEPV
ncbi:MAG TPA: hypothetical protein VIQ76_12765, partial [Propionibacteriaceae bacterium]